MATIDSRIPLAFQSPQINSPAQNKLAALAVRGAEMDLDMKGQALQQRNALMELSQRPDFYNSSGGINPAMMPEIGRVAPDQALGYSKAIQGQQKALSDAQMAQLNQAKTQLELVGRLVGGVTDETSFQAARQQAQAYGIPLDGVPAQYDPRWVQQTRQQTLTAQQQIDNFYKEQGLNMQQQRLQHDINQSGTTTLQKNLAAAGLSPGTPEYQQAVLDGSRGTTVNVGAGDKAWDTESAKLFAKRYDDISSGAVNAQQMMGMYDLAEQALNSGVRTGLGADAEITLRQLGAAMGMNTEPEKLAGGELVRAVQNRMALLMRSPDGGMGMPGALSDRDIRFLKDSQIGIDRSPEGNRAMLQAFRAMEKRKIEMAQLADQYIQENGRLDAGFNRTLREFAEANPIFDPGQPLTGGTRDSQLDDILGL
ncbi:hypothetical protein DUD43_07400 [Alcaligenes faecalis]|uniref:hypothetical protein n=1 Tax=Alcaligenes faecalis TaxID=511 RepID=UPI001293B67D|nr:hypothetical protein [Alcaligenes faecalis]QFY77525.1 hypothetical protein DUD43_07400 [Alcaligenes faecalis]